MARLYRRARTWDQRTRQRGRHGGIVGPVAMAVLEAMITDFFNYQSGRLDPSYAAIARRAGICVRSVASGLARLRQLGILTWIRRCHAVSEDGRHGLRQDTNAYTIEPMDKWAGCPLREKPPAPHPATWAAPRLPDAMEDYQMELRLSGDRGTALRLLGDDGGPLATALASLRRAMDARLATEVAMKSR